MNYEKMTLAELRDTAKELGIKGVSTMKKGELTQLLQAVKGHQAAGKAVQKDGRHPAKDTREGRTTAVKKEGEAEEKKMEDTVAKDPAARQARNVSEKTEVRQKTDSIAVDHNLDSGKEANGILEVMPDGFGFIRCENYLPGENDIYVSPAQIKRFNLKSGDIIIGNQKVKTEKEKFAALLYIKTINGYPLEEAVKRKNFEDLTPIFPDERIRLENQHAKGISMRIMDLLAPIGKGQRGMIVAPPKAGKTTLLKQIAVSISRTYKDMHLIVLLIDERPEEVTDIRETIEGPNVEVIYSTFDELPEHHKRVSEMVLERAKRLVEHKEDVVILLDSITRLARAYNLTVPPSGRTLTGGLDPAALHMPKKFFGAARNMREGGSLTVLATALVETGSKMDDVVFEEFKGTGNMELVLNRKLQEKRIFPAIDIVKSGTRRDDLLLTPLELEAVEAMHKEFSGNRAEDTIEEVLKLFVRTKDNKEFLDLIKRSLLRK
ncbi:MAG: transcription termination factor Rho [Clostridium sp.]|nr:transcription termination factor Rho [Clostridium sp.]